MEKRHLFLLIAPMFAVLLDAGVTLTGQPATYWAGNYHTVHELSPDIHRILAVGPTTFFGFVVLWLSAIAVLLILMPRTLSLALSSAVTIRHRPPRSSPTLFASQVVRF